MHHSLLIGDNKYAVIFDDMHDEFIYTDKFWTSEL